MNYAVIFNGVVENIVVLDDVSAWSPPDGRVIAPLAAGAGIGSTFDGQNFGPIPAEPSPL